MILMISYSESQKNNTFESPTIFIGNSSKNFTFSKRFFSMYQYSSNEMTITALWKKSMAGRWMKSFRGKPS